MLTFCRDPYIKRRLANVSILVLLIYAATLVFLSIWGFAYNTGTLAKLSILLLYAGTIAFRSNLPYKAAP